MSACILPFGLLAPLEELLLEVFFRGTASNEGFLAMGLAVKAISGAIIGQACRYAYLTVSESEPHCEDGGVGGKQGLLSSAANVEFCTAVTVAEEGPLCF